MTLFQVNLHASLFGYDAEIDGDAGIVDFYCNGIWIFGKNLV